MSILLRTLVLLLFAAFGLALAVGVVCILAPPSAQSPSTPQSFSSAQPAAPAEASPPKAKATIKQQRLASHVVAEADETPSESKVAQALATDFRQRQIEQVEEGSAAPPAAAQDIHGPSPVRTVAANQPVDDATSAIKKALAELGLGNAASQAGSQAGQTSNPSHAPGSETERTATGGARTPSAQVSAAPTATSEMPLVSRQSVAGEGDGQLNINIPGTDIREVLELLSRAGNLNILASKNVTGNVKASLTGVDVETALDAILRSTGYVARRDGDFVYVGTSEDFQAMDHAIDRIATRVFRPNYVTAAELQALITPMLTTGVGTVSISSAAEVGIGSNADEAGGDNFAGAEVVLVRDYEAILCQIDQVFAEVDRRPLQVSIEAMILSVELSDEQSLGIDWELFRNKNNVRLLFGSPLDNLNNIDVATNSGLVFGYLDSSISLFLDALESVGTTHVISSPRLMCLNKQRAEIHIGEERGYVSTTVTETAATQSVEFLEVGTQLRLRPFISNDGLVRLEIHPELSTGTVEVSENFTLPNKTVTQVTTNVMVRDGATLVIGGLLREELQSDVEQIPLMGSLPLVGPMFRSKTDTTNRDEIVVLITPRIVWEPQFNCEGEYANCEFYQQHAIFADKISKLSRVHYGRRYYRLAKAAWAAGEARAALRYINMSVHFNPLERNALHLRSEIIANSPYGDRTVDTHLCDGLAPWQHPRIGRHLTDWVLDEWHGPNTHLGQQGAPVHHPGQTGHSSDIHLPPPVAVPRPLGGPEQLDPAPVRQPQEQTEEFVVPDEG